jgi:NAD(P)H-hydrate epimerase
MHDETKDAVKDIIEKLEETGTPLLLDADGVKAFAEFKRNVKCPMVLTPHSKEFEILAGKKLPQSQKDRIDEVKKMANKIGGTIVLKGPVDLITDGTLVKFNFTGNPGMTVGGTGDVLSGVIGGLMAMGTPPIRAATAGAFINGAAGDFVYSEKGYHMIPTDLMEWIPQIMDDPMCHLEVRIDQF